MNRFALTLTGVATILLAALTPLHSQGVKPSSTIEKLEALKRENEKLLLQQDATLKKLDEVLKDAQQLRVFARRT